MLQNTASARIELSEMDVQTIKVVQRGNAIVVTGAQGKTLRIYNLIGVELASVQIDSQEKRIDLSRFAKGIYPVKVGGISKKIHLNGR